MNKKQKTENKKERKELESGMNEIADNELDKVSGGFLRKINSKITPASGNGDGNDTQG